jgi:glycosyltransferase involved in cell wall biosynthesis
VPGGKQCGDMTATRVAIQLISTGGIYGAERALLELAGYLSDQGWESHVVALEGHGAGPLADIAAAQGLTAEAFISSGRLGLLPMALKLRRLLARYPGAIVHAHGYKADILLSWMGAQRRLGCLATCHNWISETRKLKLFEALDKRALRHFDRVVAVSAPIARELLRAGVSAQRVSVIPNGISVPAVEDGDRVSVRAEFGVLPGGKLIVQIGRLARSKRIDLLLQAVSKLPDDPQTHVLLAGEGEQREFLAQVAKRYGLERRVHFCGYRRDVGRLLAEADLMALSSELEGLPIVILEAMATGCPIVTTRVGAIPDVLTDGHDAWIVPASDPDALRRAISEVFERPEVATSRAVNARTRYLRLYSRDAMGAQYLQIYEDVWNHRQRPT